MSQSKLDFDTVFTSIDTTHNFQYPKAEVGKIYHYQLEETNVQIEDGDTVSNEITYDTIKIKAVKDLGSATVYKLYPTVKIWKSVIGHIDSLEIPWDSTDVPQVLIKVGSGKDNMSLYNFDEVHTYVSKEMDKRKPVYDTLYPGKKMYYITKEELLSRKNILFNWFTFISNIQSIFDIYKSPFPLGKKLTYTLSRQDEDRVTIVHLYINKERLKNGNTRYEYGEDESKGRTAYETLMDSMKQLQSKHDSSFVHSSISFEDKTQNSTILDENFVLMKITNVSTTEYLRPERKSYSLNKSSIRHLDL